MSETKQALIQELKKKYYCIYEIDYADLELEFVVRLLSRKEMEEVQVDISDPDLESSNPEELTEKFTAQELTRKTLDLQFKKCIYICSRCILWSNVFSLEEIANDMLPGNLLIQLADDIFVKSGFPKAGELKKV